MGKKLSLIIPIYNGEKYIARTLSYIQKSVYKNLEIILVNDGSTDASLEIIESIKKNDSRIIIYNKKNEGVVSARNYGAMKATGEFIGFVDQDDIIKPEMYSKLIKHLLKDESDMAICSSGRSINGKESVFDYMQEGIYEGEEIRKHLLYPIIFNGFDVPIERKMESHYSHIWTCIFKMSFWKENNIQFRAYVNFEDDLLVKIETLCRAKKVSTVPYVGYLWRVNLKSESYAHHYVENIGVKQEQIYEDIKSSLSLCESKQEVFRLLKQVTYCKHYVEAVHNLSSPEIKKNRAFIFEYYKKNIYDKDFQFVIEGRKYLSKGRIRLGILLPLLASKRTILSYFMELFIDWCLVLSLHSQMLTKLERKLKYR